MKKNILETSDGVKIAADLYEAENPIGWLVLIHMMPVTKESWRDFAQDAQKAGYESIAIDLRGHGKSSGGPEGFLKFSDKEHQESILDLEAAVNYLIKEKKAKPEKIYFIGASIGANLALQYIVNPPAGGQEFKKAVLLSPGLNYRGIETEPLVKKLQAGHKILFIASEDDERSGGNNVKMNQRIYDLAPADVEKKIQIYETGGHGTDIMKNHPELKGSIINFLEK